MLNHNSFIPQGQNGYLHPENDAEASKSQLRKPFGPFVTSYTNTPEPTEPLPADLVATTDVQSGLDKWATYCPCSLCSHACQNPTCDKLQVCGKGYHTSRCTAGYNHDLKATCIRLISGDDVCPDGDECPFGHDFEEDRALLCQTHHCSDH